MRLKGLLTCAVTQSNNGMHGSAGSGVHVVDRRAVARAR